MNWLFQVSTLSGFSLAALLVALWIAFPQYHSPQALGGLLVGILLKVPDEIWTRWIALILLRAPRLFARFRPSPGPARSPVSTKESTTVIDIATIKAKVAAAAETIGVNALEEAVAAAAPSQSAEVNAVVNAGVALFKERSWENAVTLIEDLIKLATDLEAKPPAGYVPAPAPAPDQAQ